MNWETLLFLGDSLTFGARSYLSYAEYVSDELRQIIPKEWNVINHSTNGYRAIDLARSISSNYSDLEIHKPLFTSILIGTNDVKINTPIEDYKIALQQVILKAKLITMNQNVLLIQLPEFTKGISYPYKLEMNHSIQKFNEAIIELSEINGLKTMKFDFSEDHFSDGVHFNRGGSQYLGKQLSNYILKERGCI